MIVRGRLDSIPPNFACAQDEFYINGAILNFDQHKGRKFSEMFISTLLENYDGESFAANGPTLITYVLGYLLCENANVTQMSLMNNCKGFHVLKSSVCYAIPYTVWEALMKEDYADYVMDKTSVSLVVHFWNNLSHGTKLNATSSAAYIRLAREYCPRVMKQVKTVF